MTSQEAADGDPAACEMLPGSKHLWVVTNGTSLYCSPFHLIKGSCLTGFRTGVTWLPSVCPGLNLKADLLL